MITIETKSVREHVLDNAKEVVMHDRNLQYGSPEDNFGDIAKFWSIYTGTKLTAKDVAVMMILLKSVRAMHGKKQDNYIDIAGYAACAAECESRTTLSE